MVYFKENYIFQGSREHFLEGGGLNIFQEGGPIPIET